MPPKKKTKRSVRPKLPDLSEHDRRVLALHYLRTAAEHEYDENADAETFNAAEALSSVRTQIEHLQRAAELLEAAGK